MALMLDADRVLCWMNWMDDNRQDIGVVKMDLRAAIDATDVWLDTNQTGFNAALPLPARTTLTVRQKAILLMVVIARRARLA